MTTATEDGEVPQTLEAYISCTGRANKWMDHYTALAASRVLETEILVWKYSLGKWRFLESLKPPTVNCHPVPICLFLRDGHFTTLPVDVAVPEGWRKL